LEVTHFILEIFFLEFDEFKLFFEGFHLLVEIGGWGRAEEGGGSGSGGKEVQLDHWQSLLLGGLSGGMGPLANNPLGAFWKEPLWVECCSILLMRIM